MAGLSSTSPALDGGLEGNCSTVDDKIEALVFDCDGTLVNSMEYFWVGWEQLVAKYELDFPTLTWDELLVCKKAANWY